GEEEVVMEALCTYNYNRENSQSFTFAAAQQEDRQRPAELLVSVVEQSLPRSSRVTWLQSIRILSRACSCLDTFTSCQSLQALACYAGVSEGAAPGPLNMDVVLESRKCLCNLVLSSPQAQALAAEARLVVRLAQHVGLHRESSFPHEVQLFDLRLLSLLRGAPAAVQELQGAPVLTDALAVRAMAILKVLFNITFHSIRREADEENCLSWRLGTLLWHCVMAAAVGDTEEFHGHTASLGNLPVKCLGVLLALEPRKGSLEFLGVNVDEIGALLSFLEKRRHQTHRLKESVPVLSVLTECARLHRPAPPGPGAAPLRDVKTRPVEELLRNKLVGLMTHLDTDVKRVARSCCSSCAWRAARFIKCTGYGNAAGLLAARDLVAGGWPEGQYSEDSDSVTEEYKEAKASINPETGRVEMKPPNPMEGMTEEQKEQEAMKLVTMLDRLSRHSHPAHGVSPRGQLTSLQDAVCESTEGQLPSDTDSDRL
uniref:Synembryn n=1 Tax=Myotis lucifugus TaxID=59463 RepID=G1Q182_MYOLU